MYQFVVLNPWYWRFLWFLNALNLFLIGSCMSFSLTSYSQPLMVYSFMVSPRWGTKKSEILIHVSLHIIDEGWIILCVYLLSIHRCLLTKGLFNPCWWLPQIVRNWVSGVACSSSLCVTSQLVTDLGSQIVDGYAITWCTLSSSLHSC